MVNLCSPCTSVSLTWRLSCRCTRKPKLQKKLFKWKFLHYTSSGNWSCLEDWALALLNSIMIRKTRWQGLSRSFLHHIWNKTLFAMPGVIKRWLSTRLSFAHKLCSWSLRDRNWLLKKQIKIKHKCMKSIVLSYQVPKMVSCSGLSEMISWFKDKKDPYSL